MESQFKTQLEQGARMAFDQYRQRHPNLARHLESNRSNIISTAVASIENDPDVISALEDADAENGLQKIVDVVAQHLPKLISIL